MELRDKLIAESNRLELITEKVRGDLGSAPEGSLHLGKTKGYVQYYHSYDGTTYHGTYIPKNNRDLAKQLAQKEYNTKILKYSKHTISQINRLLKEFEDNKIEKIYNSEHPERQKLITPIEPTYDMLLKEWMKVPYVGKAFDEKMPVILTNRGLRVRSKSEKIMADYFDSIGLAYKYECPLFLKPYGTIYPDFTFLSPKTKKEIYWEHEGKLDNENYAQRAVKKIALYEKNGIFPGEQLILTFESSITAIDVEILKMLTQRYLI